MASDSSAFFVTALVFTASFRADASKSIREASAGHPRLVSCGENLTER